MTATTKMSRRWLAVTAGAVMLFAAACGSSSDSSSGATDGSAAGGGGDAAACAPAAAGEKVELNFYSWIPGIEKVVATWNAANPDIQVNVATGPSGNAGAYQNFSNGIQAGNAPDLMQIEFDRLPNFRIQDGLANIAACPGVSDSQSQFVDWTWSQATFGEENAVYAIPQDTGPMALFYRKDLFEKAGIPVPTTWDEFKTAAEAVKAEGAFITNFSSGDPNQFAGFVWQNQGKWFDNTGDGWTVELTSQPSADVADYWQGLIDAKLVSSVKNFTDEWNKAANSGELWAWVSAVWGNQTIEANAPSTSGKWAVAPMPQWTAGGTAAGNWGGSTTAVFKGSEHPAEAAKFALWLNTSTESLTELNSEGGLYPATTAGQELPALQEPSAFYGGQEIFAVFNEASAQVDPNFTWGPVMNETYNSLTDGFGAALNGQGTLADALAAAQTKTIDAMKAQSIPVVE